MTSAAVLVGLFDGYMNQKDDHAALETKIGGRPTYSCELTPTLINEINELTRCKVCGEPMFLLLQAFSPLQSVMCDSVIESEGIEDINEESVIHNVGNWKQQEWQTPKEEQGENEHNRMLYVFCCNSASCAKEPQRSWSAFSLQVNNNHNNVMEKEHIKHAEQEEEEKEKEEKCKEVKAMSNESNTEIDEDGSYEPLSPLQLAPHCFPPCFIFVEDEPHDTAAPLTSLEQELLRKAEQNKATLSSEDQRELEELAQIVERGHDYYYDKFRHRLERAPTQVLRYYQADLRLDHSAHCASISTNHHHHNTNITTCVFDANKNMKIDKSKYEYNRWILQKREKPLFMNPPMVAQGIAIPPCAECGGPRTHELQIMSTALFYLHVEDYVPQRVKDKHQSGKETSKSQNNSDENDENSTAKLLERVNMGAGLDGVDFGTVTVYTCAHECARHHTGVYLRKEFVCVEEAPPMHLPSQSQEEEEQQNKTI